MYVGYVGLRPDDRLGHFASVAFDVSITDTFGSMARGLAREWA